MKSAGKMPRALAAAVTAILIPLSGAAIAQPAGRSASSDPYQQQYSSLADHNIFVSSRVRADVPRSGPIETPLPPQKTWIVTGIVSKDQQQYVIVENLLNGSVQQLHKGDRLAGGTVNGIAIDSMSFKPDNRDGAIAIRVGADLSGTTARATGYVSPGKAQQR